MTKNVAILLGLGAGLALGLAAALTGAPGLHAAAVGAAPLGTAFVKLIRLVVIPLVGTTLFSRSPPSATCAASAASVRTRWASSGARRCWRS